MFPAGKPVPGAFRRSLLILGLLAWEAAFGGQPPSSGRVPELAQVGLPDAARAAEILDQFRTAGIAGEYYLEFQLRAMPRRGDATNHAGRMWGARSRSGATTRVEVEDAAGIWHRFLLRNGPEGEIWRLVNGRPEKIGAAESFEPLIPGIDITPFDLQMPYLFWPDARLQSINRIRGRPAHAFLFRAPETLASTAPGRVGAVRAFLDTQYNALVQSEILDPEGSLLKTLSLISIKTIDRRTLPRTIDFRNDLTRDKTRFHVTAAALGLDLGPAPFDPQGLADDIRPPVDAVRRLE